MDQNKFDATICCNSQELRKFYDDHSIETTICHLSQFRHTTGGQWSFTPRGITSAISWIYNFKRSNKYLQDLLLKDKPDIVHLNSVTLVPFLKTIKKCNCLTVVHIREYIVNGIIGIRKKILKHLINKYADRTIFICSHYKDVLKCNNGIVVYNPVDLSKFSYINKKAMKRKLGINDNCKVVLYVGGYKLIKGPLVFVNALDKIITKIPDVKFLLPSTLNVVPSSISKKVLIRIAAFWRLYSTRQKVERVIEKYNIKNLLIMSNYSNHIEEYYAASDVAVIPFTKPHFARPVIEAGAAAIPVVASRIGGITEVVGDGKNGFLFTPGNSDELADKVIKCLKDENLASKMGNEGYGIAKSRYNSSIHASKISRLYSSI